MITHANVFVHAWHSGHSSTNINPNTLFQHDNERFLNKEILEGWEECSLKNVFGNISTFVTNTPPDKEVTESKSWL